jgi:Zn-dependent M28 family amino/carboxypeptidase
MTLVIHEQKGEDMSMIGILHTAMVTVILVSLLFPGSGCATSREGNDALAKNLRAEVETLSVKIGERNFQEKDRLDAAAAYIERAFMHENVRVARQAYSFEGKPFHNIEAEIRGTIEPDRIIVVGAHYDTAVGTPGANDNASGVAALIELVRIFSTLTPDCTVRFVAFANEEPPFFWSKYMGSLVYARECRRKGENIAGMISIETIGYYSEVEKTQRYPFPLNCFKKNRKGNFIAFVSNLSSRELLDASMKSFRQHSDFPVEGMALPAFVPRVVSSDHSSFWRQGFKAIMVTDTARFRYPYYHKPQDLPERMDFQKMSLVVEGIGKMTRAMAWPKT